MYVGVISNYLASRLQVVIISQKLEYTVVGMAAGCKFASDFVEEVCLLCDMLDGWMVRMCMLATSVLYMGCATPQYERSIHYLLWLLRILIVTALVADLVEMLILTIFPLELRWACKINKRRAMEVLGLRIN